MSEVLAEIKAEADRLEWDALYSMKGHFNASMLWNAAHYTLGISGVVLGVLAAKQSGAVMGTWASIIVVVSAAITAVITFLKPSEKAKPHHAAGVFYGDIKRKARMFQNISMKLESDPRVLRKELDAIVTAYHERQKNDPPIPRLAYEISRLGVRRGEHDYNEKGERK